MPSWPKTETRLPPHQSPALHLLPNQHLRPRLLAAKSARPRIDRPSSNPSPNVAYSVRQQSSKPHDPRRSSTHQQHIPSPQSFECPSSDILSWLHGYQRCQATVHTALNSLVMPSDTSEPRAGPQMRCWQSSRAGWVAHLGVLNPKRSSRSPSITLSSAVPSARQAADFTTSLRPTLILRSCCSLFFARHGECGGREMEKRDESVAGHVRCILSRDAM